MTKKTIIMAIKNTLRYLGYELQKSNFFFKLGKINSPENAFFVQSELIKVREPVIFDVGAYVGSVTKKYREYFPLASIYSFEPFPQSFEKLLHNVGGDTNIFCNKLAISEKKGRSILNANSLSTTNSLLATNKNAHSYWGKGLLDTTSQIEVETSTIDSFFLDNGIPHIDILKLDVQGAEFSVFTGAKNALSNQKISLIYSELIICPTYKGQHKLHEYLVFLDSFGYEFVDFFNPVRSHNQLLQVDALFVSSSHRKNLNIG